ncbi:hypothetical protein GP486_006506 [Trichoglossum hirsutum]|uniref:Uncharacterized protein n=1 Tax=Trichoglossum hirsutum TaxID=265104 RepID=A0A9P8IJ33_9PEZI|nr:hypothetical protein GP486_006506 [Trichoglossum hirsutum]
MVFTNQGAVSLKGDPKTIKRDQKNLATFKGRVTASLNQLDFPISVYAATSRDRYRKPRTGMWEEMLKDCDLGGASLDLENSFFVGDAAGRPATDGSSQDFSCSDRNFAANIGIRFYTPEEFFLNEPSKSFTRDFDPAMYLNKSEVSSATSNNPMFSKENLLDIVMFCGSPGSGKSTFYWKHVRPLGYERANQDVLKTREKCRQIASRYLSEGKSVVIDNTNPDPDTRAVWVQLARKHDVPIRCIYFTAPTQLCMHNDTVRALNGDTTECTDNASNKLNPEKRAILPSVAFTSFTARFQKPTPEEGFTDIARVDFHAMQFEGSAEERSIWGKYWI